MPYSEKIEALRAKGELVISEAVFKKQAKLTGERAYVSSGIGGYLVVYEYKGKKYTADWILTPMHDQFEHLTLASEEAIFKAKIELSDE